MIMVHEIVIVCHAMPFNHVCCSRAMLDASNMFKSHVDGWRNWSVLNGYTLSSLNFQKTTTYMVYLKLDRTSYVVTPPNVMSQMTQKWVETSVEFCENITWYIDVHPFPRDFIQVLSHLQKKRAILGAVFKTCCGTGVFRVIRHPFHGNPGSITDGVSHVTQYSALITIDHHSYPL